MMVPVETLTPVSQAQLYDIARRSRGYISYAYLHWTAGNYGQAYDDYHICIDQDGRVYMMCDELTEYKAHTYHRNTGAIGIALLCCAGAEANNGYNADFGDQPPTAKQIEVLAQTVDTLSNALGLQINLYNFMTHAEAADNADGRECSEPYGPATTCERWDLWYLPDNAQGGQMVPGGQLIRDKAAWYQRQEAPDGN